MHKIYYSLVLLLLALCGSRDTDFFNGEIINIKDKAVKRELKFKDLEFDGFNFGFFSVYDSLAIYMNPKLSSHWYQVFNLKSGEEVGKFAMKGNGHKDFTPVGPIFNYCFENNELKTLIFEANKEEVHIWNVTKSIAENTTVVERQVKMPWRKENKGACFNQIFMSNGSTLYGKVDANPINDHEATLPYYQIRDLENGEKTDEIHVFKKNVVNKHAECLPETFLYSTDAMKPDGSKIAQAMLCVPQLNIIDTKTKKAVAYQLDYGVTISDLEKAENIKPYFLRICADDEHIYAVFCGKEQGGQDEILCENKLYVFDWNGHLVSKITTKHCIDEIMVDSINKVLYTTSPMDEKLYYINTDELIGDTHS